MQGNKKTATVQRSNPFTDAFRKEERSANIEVYRREFSARPFYESRRAEYQVAKIAVVLGNVVSIVTSAAFLYFRMDEARPDFITPMIYAPVAGFFSVGVLSMLEVMKRSNTGALFREICLHRKAPTKNIIVLFVFSFLSFLFSVLGAVDIARRTTDESHGMKTSQEEEVRRVSDSTNQLIELITIETKGIKSRNADLVRRGKLNSLTDNDNASIQGNRSDIEQLRQEAAAKIEKIEKKYAGVMVDNSDLVTRTIMFLLSLSIAAELVTLLGLRFEMLYKYRSHIEPHEPRPQDAHKPIRSDNRVQSTNDREKTARAPVTRKDECKQCGNPYDKRAPHQKFCTDLCRVTSYEKRTGADLGRFKKKG